MHFQKFRGIYFYEIKQLFVVIVEFYYCFTKA